MVSDKGKGGGGGVTTVAMKRGSLRPSTRTGMRIGRSLTTQAGRRGKLRRVPKVSSKKFFLGRSAEENDGRPMNRERPCLSGEGKQATFHQLNRRLKVPTTLQRGKEQALRRDLLVKNFFARSTRWLGRGGGPVQVCIRGEE